MLLGKLQVDLTNDPNTIEYMIGNKERAKLTVEADSRNESTRRFWLSLAAKLVMSRSLVSTCVQQVTAGPTKRRGRSIDRLKERGNLKMKSST